MKLSFFPAACLFLCMSVFSHAGVLLVQSYQKLDSTKTVNTNKIYVDKDRVRIDAGAKLDQFFVYRADKKMFWAVNTKEKSYVEMTEKDLTEMFSKIEEAKKKMEASMATMPPAQREMMEKMMAKMAPAGADAPKTTYKKIGAGGKVNGWNTDKYEGIRDGAKHSEIWTAAPKVLDVETADYEVMRDMAKFFEKFAKNMEGMMGNAGNNGLQGIPVKTITFKDGQPVFQSEIKEVKKENLVASLFEVPVGFQKKEMAKMK